jgi:hypothetical protein
MQRGQTTIEFLFIILITIVYITTVTTPLVKSAQTIIYDTENISRTNNETQKIVNTINELATLSSGSRQTINIFLPENTSIYCANKNISFTTVLKQEPWPTQCPNGNCTKTLTPILNTDLNCTPSTLVGPLKTKLVIEKGETKVFLIEAG